VLLWWNISTTETTAITITRTIKKKNKWESKNNNRKKTTITRTGTRRTKTRTKRASTRTRTRTRTRTTTPRTHLLSHHVRPLQANSPFPIHEAPGKNCFFTVISNNRNKASTTLHVTITYPHLGKGKSLQTEEDVIVPIIHTVAMKKTRRSRLCSF